MKTLEVIFIDFELGEISPENLPNEIYKIIETTDVNEYLVRLTNLFEPKREDVLELICPAFGITESEFLSKKEKFALLFNRWSNNKISSDILVKRITDFELEDCMEFAVFDRFIQNLKIEIDGYWVPGDEWYGTIRDIENEVMKFKNRYAQYIIKL